MAKQTFTTGQVLTAAQVNALQANDFNQTVSTKTASYVLVAADKGTRIVMNSTSATTITVNTGLFDAGDTLYIHNTNSGVCTITAGTATVATSGSLVLAQNQGGVLYFTSASASIFFQYATPASGDIEGVTAGTGISGGGTSGTVTITNSMATEITAAGDIIVGTGSGTFDNLPIGTTGQILTADTTVSPYKVKWASGSSSGATLINRTAFSASSGTTIDNLFSSTYERYLVKVAVYGSSAGATFGIQGRYSTTTYTTADYKYGYRGLTSAGGAADTASGGVGAWYFPAIIGTASTALSIMDINIYRTNGSNYLFQTTTGWDNGPQAGYAGAGVIPSSQTWTGLYLFASAGTITGNVSIYGLASA